jgi:hypothetical protein
VGRTCNVSEETRETRCFHASAGGKLIRRLIVSCIWVCVRKSLAIERALWCGRGVLVWMKPFGCCFEKLNTQPFREAHENEEKALICHVMKIETQNYSRRWRRPGMLCVMCFLAFPLSLLLRRFRSLDGADKDIFLRFHSCLCQGESESKMLLARRTLNKFDAN